MFVAKGCTKLPMAQSPLTISVAPTLSAVPAADWNALAQSCQPFVEHGFLAGLESSGSVGTMATGWLPQHLLAWADGQLVGALPLYAKLDPFGEYVFDGAWCEAAQRAGLSYYPKLVSAVPFTPVTGARLRAPMGGDAAVARALIAASCRLADRAGAGGVHVLFCGDEEAQLWRSAGFVLRHNIQFQWHRRAGWESFDDVLASLRAPARKQVRQERRRAASHGLVLEMVEGTQLTDEDWRALHAFYLTTLDRKGGCAYLTPAFFVHLRERMPGAIVAALARRPGDGQPMAGALFLRQGDTLWGRYWGALGDFDALHFELCYHLPIAWGLMHGIAHIEAGAQGLHKHKRGFLPVVCTSAHRLGHPGLHAAVADSLKLEEQHTRASLAALQAHSPFPRLAPLSGHVGAGGAEGLPSP